MSLNSMHNDRGSAVQVATIVTIVMAFMFVALRMISRIFITRHTTWDDYIMVIAWFIAFGGSLVILFATQLGFGLIDADLKPEWIPSLKKYGYAYSILYNPSLMATKTSILIFYLRLSRVKKLFRIGTYATIGVVNVVGLILTFINIFQCHPFHRIFSETLRDPSQRCIPLVTLFLASSPANVFTDVAILLLPIPVLTGIHLPRRQKSILIFTFGLGIFVTVVDVVRIYYLQQALGFTTGNSRPPQETPGLGATPDFLYNIAYGLMWSIVEVNMGIVCGCIPLLKPLVVRTMPKLISSPGFHTTQTSSETSATQTRPEEFTLRRHTAQNNVEGLTPLHFRMPGTPLPEMSMTPAPDVGDPGEPIQNSHRMSVSSVGGVGEAPSQPPSRRASLSPFREGGSAPHQPSQRRSLQPSQEPLVSPVLGRRTPMDQTESSTSMSTDHESDSPRRRFLQQIEPAQKHDAEDQTENTAEAGPEGSPSHEQRNQQQTQTLDFLTVPERGSPPQGGSGPSQQNQIHFGFVKIRQPKSMLRTSTKGSWRYCAWVSVSFFLLGFSYGLLNTLNVQIAVVAHYTQALTVSLHTVYFGAYIFGPLTVGLYCLKKGGFKVTIMVGLGIFGTGTLIFWPSSILLAYPGFIVSNFIIGFGLSVFETAGNPFVILCGPPRYGEFRLLSVNFVRNSGAIFSQVLVEKAFFPIDEVHDDVLSIRWTYLTISFITVIIALVFHYMPLPEASDEDLQTAVQTRLPPFNHTINDDPGNRFFGCRIVYISLAFACFAQIAYVFTQETFNVWFNNSLLSSPAQNFIANQRRHISTNFVLIGHCAFSASLLLAAALCLYVRPRFVLFGSLLSSAAIRLTFTLIPAELAKENSAKVAGLAIAQYFCEGPIYPIIFGLALRGLGAKTKLGSALVVTMNGAGAAGPWVVLGIIKGMGDARRPFVAGVALLFIATLYPVYLSVVPKAREIVDWNDAGGVESERQVSRPDSIATAEAADTGVHYNGHGTHWPALLEVEFEHIRRASVTSGKAVSKWAASVKDWTRRVSGFGGSADEREFA